MFLRIFEHILSKVAVAGQHELYFSFFLPRYNLAGFLINIVFSSLFLGTQIPNVAVIWKQAGPQLMYGMLIAWGQWIVALVVTGALLVRTPCYPSGHHHISPMIISLLV